MRRTREAGVERGMSDRRSSDSHCHGTAHPCPETKAADSDTGGRLEEVLEARDREACARSQRRSIGLQRRCAEQAVDGRSDAPVRGQTLEAERRAETG